MVTLVAEVIGESPGLGAVLFVVCVINITL